MVAAPDQSGHLPGSPLRLFLSQEGNLQAETLIVAVARRAGSLILQDQLPEAAT